MNEILNDKASSEVAEAVRKCIESAADDLSANEVLDLAFEMTRSAVNKGADEYVSREDDDINSFLINQKSKWGSIFKLLKIHHGLCRQAGTEFVDERKDKPDYVTNQRFGVLVRFHCRAVRIYEEIIWLLEGGFPDAAYSRWRTMLEIAVLAITIREKSEETAIDYVQHRLAEKAEATLGCDDLAELMNFRQLETSEREALKKLVGFKVDWMKTHGVAIGKPFKLLKNSRLSHWIADYGVSSLELHGKQLQDSDSLAMSEFPVDGFLLGRSNQGVSRVAHLSSLMLSIVTMSLISLIEHEENESCNLSYATFSRLILESDNDIREGLQKLSPSD